jgi:predicted GIY-YIG superfamily endonuclease
MDRQALSAIKHSSATQTELLSCANSTRYVGMSDDSNYRYYDHIMCHDIGRRGADWVKELQ